MRAKTSREPRPPRTTGTNPHHEDFVGTESGKRLRLSCHCAIGENHAYADWLTMHNEELTAAHGPRKGAVRPTAS